MNILLTGGNGYIGSHTCIELLNEGFNVTVVDNLSNSNIYNISNIEKITNKKIKFFNFDLTNINSFNVMNNLNFDCIIHFAAYKNVNESTIKVIEYYDNNICSLLNIIKYFGDKCKKIIFSSSCTVYSNIKEIPVKEDDILGDIFTLNNPYGSSKLICEKILYDLVKFKNNRQVISLRYFNPVGCHPSGLIGEDFKSDNKYKNLFPNILSSVYYSKKLNIYGNKHLTNDGTCVRDYIHVIDVARAHIFSLKYLLNINDNIYNIYNLGLGRGISVLEIIEKFKNYGFKIEYEFKDKRDGDKDIIFANPTKFENELGFKTLYDLSDMVLHSINYYNINK